MGKKIGGNVRLSRYGANKGKPFSGRKRKPRAVPAAGHCQIEPERPFHEHLFGDYESAKRAAVWRAETTGLDHGVELIGTRWDGNKASAHLKHWVVYALPARRDRCDNELRCEVVSCSDLSRCHPGHGPLGGLQ